MNFKSLNLILSASAIAAMTIISPVAINSSFAQEAETTGTNLSEEKGEDSQEVQDIANLDLAYSLAEYGRENEDPQMLISAAKIIAGIPSETLNREKVTEDEEETATADDSKQEQRDFTARELLAEAREMADNDSTIIAMIDTAEESITNSRGRVGGPTRHVSSVSAGNTDVYRLKFRAGYRARIGVKGDGDTDLDCYLYDSNGNLVRSDTDYSDSCLLGWTPAWTGSYTLRIKNRGRVYNRYLLLTN